MYHFWKRSHGNFSHRILGIRIQKKNSTGKQFVTPFHSIRGSSHQRRHPTSRNGGQDLMKNDAKGLCICGGCKVQMSPTGYSNRILYTYIYIHFFDHFFPPIFLGGCQFGVALRRTLRFGTPGAFAPEKTKVKVQYLWHLNWRVVMVTFHSWQTTSQQDWWWSWWSWSWYCWWWCIDIPRPNASATGLNSCYYIFHHLPNTR